MSFGMAFAGGGTRGAAHVGVLMALEENGLRPDAVSGASAGGIVAGLYAAGFAAKELHEVVEELSKKGMLLVDPAYGDILLALGQFLAVGPCPCPAFSKGIGSSAIWTLSPKEKSSVSFPYVRSSRRWI